MAIKYNIPDAATGLEVAKVVSSEVMPPEWKAKLLDAEAAYELKLSLTTEEVNANGKRVRDYMPKRTLNLTPHSITYKASDGITVTWAAFEGGAARCSLVPKKDAIEKTLQGGIIKLSDIGIYELDESSIPSPLEPTDVLIVSTIVAETIRKMNPDDRLRVFRYPTIEIIVPNSGPGSVERNEKGEIVAVKEFLRYPAIDGS